MSFHTYLHATQMKWHRFLHGGGDETTLIDFAERVLKRLEALPPDTATGPAFVPHGAECAMSMVDDHWGIYGAGATSVDRMDGSYHAAQLLLDPAWLDHDLRAQEAREPWLFAEVAEWATSRLQTLLDLDFPPGTVLRASLPPQPTAAASGDLSSWPAASVRGGQAVKDGTVGPPVRYTDLSGNPNAEGYLTAGHVAPPDPNPTLAWVDLAQPPAGSLTARVHGSTVPAGIGSGVAGTLPEPSTPRSSKRAGRSPPASAPPAAPVVRTPSHESRRPQVRTGASSVTPDGLPPRRVLGPTVTW